MTTTMSSERLGTLPDHFHGFALMHVAMRRDAARLTAAAPRLTPAGLGPAGEWWRRLRDVIDWHHHSEDDLLWPELLRRLPEFTDGARELAGDHTALDRAMDAVGAALRPGGDPAAVAPAAAAFARVLHDHLADEERIVFPVFARLAPRDYLALEQRLVRTAPLRVLTHLPPWMADGAPRRSVALVAATMPPPVRLLGRTALRRRYEAGLRAVTDPA
ncbi:hemerythrin domain-containing protein [Streptomyces sp. WAC05374]|uniref:hemerythrin domain-containing protein n=1 Tax=Streptomyces sp. WAC05374 TaxID=2487420 RepID=UPI000F8892C5|nr:hemerythrin domain-containing protein [Streptomyces sp. WAC05374]RST15779.1 hemerythrin domain-containing protein [Streptomyces sp. WAC05374]TDF39091.1 hemerythrin domain-containing protein [Streptomyces sp. WAC05374]TDF47486.1 hemerythrin domain-containing protein [Streptomyces sp. WAC05374]TDF48199.1 hemerythrin domain-containing protein [Streptomyces sp. WAC05374]